MACTLCNCRPRVHKRSRPLIQYVHIVIDKWPLLRLTWSGWWLLVPIVIRRSNEHCNYCKILVHTQHSLIVRPKGFSCICAKVCIFVLNLLFSQCTKIILTLCDICEHWRMFFELNKKGACIWQIGIKKIVSVTAAGAHILYQNLSSIFVFSVVQTRETREGWPLLTVEIEVNGDSKSTNERDPSLVGSLGLSCRYKRLLFLMPWLL
jgi:hypothetical protein